MVIFPGRFDVLLDVDSNKFVQIGGYMLGKHARLETISCVSLLEQKMIDYSMEDYKLVRLKQPVPTHEILSLAETAKVRGIQYDDVHFTGLIVKKDNPIMYADLDVDDEKYTKVTH
jgi:hypothetical protein